MNTYKLSAFVLGLLSLLVISSCGSSEDDPTPGEGNNERVNALVIDGDTTLLDTGYFQLQSPVSGSSIGIDEMINVVYLNFGDFTISEVNGKNQISVNPNQFNLEITIFSISDPIVEGEYLNSDKNNGAFSVTTSDSRLVPSSTISSLKVTIDVLNEKENIFKVRAEGEIDSKSINIFYEGAIAELEFLDLSNLQ